MGLPSSRSHRFPMETTLPTGETHQAVDVYPSLTYRDVPAALAWLERSFGLEPMIMGPGGGGDEVLGAPRDAADGTQRGYSARDLEGNLWTFGTSRPEPPPPRRGDRRAAVPTPLAS